MNSGERENAPPNEAVESWLKAMAKPAEASLTEGDQPRQTAENGPTVRFLRGPVAWDWLAACARIPGRALHVAIALAFESGLKKRMTVKLSPSHLRELGVDADASRRALLRMETEGLVSVERRPGQAPVVTIHAPDLRRVRRKNRVRSTR